MLKNELFQIKILHICKRSIIEKSFRFTKIQKIIWAQTRSSGAGALQIEQRNSKAIVWIRWRKQQHDFFTTKCWAVRRNEGRKSRGWRDLDTIIQCLPSKFRYYRHKYFAWRPCLKEVWSHFSPGVCLKCSWRPRQAIKRY